MIKDRTATGPPSTSARSSRFLDCFGSSSEKMQLIDEVNSSSRRRSRRWSFSCKKSSTETVDVDFITVNRNSESVNEPPVKPNTTLTKTHVTSDEQKTTSRKKWTDIVKRENGSFRTRRKEIKPETTTATGAGVESPEKKTDPTTIGQPLVSSPLKPLTHSKSLPVIKKQKPAKSKTSGDGIDDGVRQKPPLSGGEIDSIIAMAILLAILVIMVLWGKLCAIFCTCAWFFVAPHLVARADGRPRPIDPVSRTDKQTNISSKNSYLTKTTTTGRVVLGTWDDNKPFSYPESQNNLNLESMEYKKKVVLEGLLQRNHRNVVGRL